MIKSDNCLKKNLISKSIFIVFLALAVPVMAAGTLVIGIWENNNSTDSYKIIIAREKNEIVLIKKYNDGIQVRQLVNELHKNDGIVFNPVDEEAEEYYILNNEGTLQIWDVFGLKTTLNIDN